MRILLTFTQTITNIIIKQSRCTRLIETQKKYLLLQILTTVEPDIDGENIIELGESDVRYDAGFSTPVLIKINDGLVAI